MFVLDIEIATAVAMASSSSSMKGKLNIDDKVKSKKYNHSFVKDIVGTGMMWFPASYSWTSDVYF